MMGWVDQLSASDVVDANSFAQYCQQETGIPLLRGRKIIALRKEIKIFFDTYPHATYFTLCRLVDWAKAKKKRYADASNLLSKGFRLAWVDGYLPELDPNYMPIDTDLEEKIEKAIAVETNQIWLRKLVIAKGGSSAQEVYESWRNYRSKIENRV